MRRIGIPLPIRRAVRMCRTGAFCAAAAYGSLGFLALHLSPAPEAVRSASVMAWGTGHASVGPPPGDAEAFPHTVVRGVLSVHTGRSHDAEGTLEEVAAAARNVGLDFVVLGDHPGEWGKGGAAALSPHRRSGVLLVPGIELVVVGLGRTLAVGLDTLPRRWDGGLEELARRSDFLSVVHPRSPRARERWDGLRAPGVDAWESFDVSEMARVRLREPWAAYHLASFLGGLLVGRGEGSLTALWREKTGTPALLSYDSVRAVQPVSLTGGLNHHPKARFGSLLLPRYEPFFRTVVNHVLIPGDLPGEPGAARDRLLEGLRAGRLFVSLGEPDAVRGFDVHGRTGGGHRVEMGGRAPWAPGSTLELRMPGGVRGDLLVRILRNGREVIWLEARPGESVTWPVNAPGIHRVEVFRGGVRLGLARAGFRPWILSNPVEFYPGDRERLALGS